MQAPNGTPPALKTTEEVKQGFTWSYFGLLCKLMAKKGSDGEMTVPEIGMLINCLSLLGITPSRLEPDQDYK